MARNATDESIEEITSAAQNPIQSYNLGNAANIGNVGIAYHNVYHAWYEIISGDCDYTSSHIRVRVVTIGNAASNPPSRSLRLAVYDTAMITLADMAYLKTI